MLQQSIAKQSVLSVTVRSDLNNQTIVKEYRALSPDIKGSDLVFTEGTEDNEAREWESHTSTTDKKR